MAKAQQCSTLSLAVGEPTIGTAPVAAAWVLVHQPGPWGREAVTESRLDHDIGRDLTDRARRAGVRTGLIRRPGRRQDSAGTVLLASTIPGATWLATLRLRSPDDLARLDLDALAAGRAPNDAEPVPGPVLAVCTNGKRDTCCAVGGRPVAAAASAAQPGRVWETSHLGGHRFAATAVLLPQGLVHGRLDADAATALLREADVGRMTLRGLRGRSTWSPAGQVAEAEVRRVTQLTELDAVRSVRDEPLDDGSWHCHVSLADQTAWTVRVRPTPPGPSRPTSCGAAPEQVQNLRAGPPVLVAEAAASA